MNKTREKISHREFIALMAILMSLVALTIDAMLPALGQMANSFGSLGNNNIQLVISSVFLGMAPGLLLYGPLSDSFGRKNAIYLGMGIFLIGSVVSVLSQSLTLMVTGRIIQGFGMASCRVVTTSMVRDMFEGREMAKIMSFIMIIFIFVPAVAPSLGQVILFFASWRAIFFMFILLGLICTAWFYFRQPETLHEDNRKNFSWPTIMAGVRETCVNPISRGYTLASGFVFGGLVAYLSTIQPILQGQYNLGKMFSVYFGLLALAIGLASFFNAKLVIKMGMEKLSVVSLFVFSLISVLFYFFINIVEKDPSLLILMVYLSISLFCFGILFANFSTLAVTPLGHIAGVANSVITSIQTFLSVALGGFIGHIYDGTVLPLVGGFCVFGVCSLLITFYTWKKNPSFVV